MNNPNYDNNESNVARGNAAGDNSAAGNNSADADATRSLSWDSAWQPDHDEDYGTPVQQYSGPGVFPPAPQPHPYAQAAQNVPASGYPNNPASGYLNPPQQGYTTPSAPNYNTPPTPYAPVTIYQGDQPMTPMQKPAPLTDQQTYRGYVPPDQQYNGQPLPPQSPSTQLVAPWVIWLVVGIILFAVFSSWGWWGFWPINGFWPLFIFWPLFWLGRWGRYGRGGWYGGRRWRNRNRW
jgi:hypothetical protein